MDEARHDAPVVAPATRSLSVGLAVGGFAGVMVGLVAFFVARALRGELPLWIVPAAAGAAGTLTAGELLARGRRLGASLRAGSALLAPLVGAGPAFGLVSLQHGELPIVHLLALGEQSSFDLFLGPAVLGMALAIAVAVASAFEARLGILGRSLVAATVLSLVGNFAFVRALGPLGLLLPHAVALGLVFFGCVLLRLVPRLQWDAS